MRKDEYGFVSLAFLLLSLHFPPYFIAFMAASALGGLGYLIKSLDESEREQLVEFEKEFRHGHELEVKGDIKGARSCFEGLLNRYPKFDYIVQEKLKQLEGK